jgi:hypothetical protein
MVFAIKTADTITISAILMAYVVLSSYKEKLKCPAEERENCEKSPRTNARKNCGKTDTRASKLILFPNSLTEARRRKAHKERRML